MSKDYTKKIKLHLRILNEYKLRHIAITEPLAKLAKHMKVVSSYVGDADGKINMSSMKDTVLAIDLMLDFMAFDEFGTGKIENSQKGWSSSVSNKIKQIQKKGSQKLKKDAADIYSGHANDIFDWFMRRHHNVKLEKDVFYSLSYLYNLSVKYGVYVTHVALLSMKTYPVGSQYTELKLLNSLEPSFWRIANEAPFSGDYLSLSPPEVNSACGIVPEEEHIFKDKHAFLVNVGSRKLDLDMVCRDIPQKLISSHIQHKLDNAKLISENDWSLYKRHHPGVSDADYAFGSIRNRAIGLTAWNMVHLEKKTAWKVHAELIRTSSIYGHRKNCDKLGCYHCVKTSACRDQFLDNYDVAVASVNLGRVVRMSDNKELKKKKK